MSRLKKIWIVVVGTLALGVTLALAVVGIAPDQSGHLWHSIQMGIKDAVEGVPKSGHLWH